MKRYLLIATLLLTTQIGFAKSVSFYKGSWEEFQKEVQKAGKPYFVDFTAVWCGPCKLMDKFVFKDNAVAEMQEAYFLAIKMDIDDFDGLELSHKYNVESIPTVLFFDAQGNLIDETIGLQTASGFLKKMQSILED